jgi:hypothetical protein
MTGDGTGGCGRRWGAMRRAPAIAILAVLVLLGACGPRQTPQGFDQRMAGFVGQSEAALVAGLGVPSRTYEAEGRRLLQWDFLQPAPGPAVYPSIGLGFGSFGFGRGVGVGTGVGLGFGGGAAPLGCSVVFETRDGMVQGFTRTGPGCVA